MTVEEPEGEGRSLSCRSCLATLLIVLITLPISFVASGLLVKQYLLATRKHPVGRQVFYTFPVLVISRDKAEVVEYEALKRYLKDAGPHTFLVPPERIEEVNRQLSRQSKDANVNIRVDILWSLKDKQYLKVTDEVGEELANTSWYIASPTGFEPKYHIRIRGREIGFIAMPLLMVTWPTAFMLGSWLYRRALSRKERRDG